jgi:hypothetical protein
MNSIKPLKFNTIWKFLYYFLSSPQKETKKSRQKEASTLKAGAHLRPVNRLAFLSFHPQAAIPQWFFFFSLYSSYFGLKDFLFNSL